MHAGISGSTGETAQGPACMDSFVFLLSVQSGQRGAHTLWESDGLAVRAAEAFMEDVRGPSLCQSVSLGGDCVGSLSGSP